MPEKDIPSASTQSCPNLLDSSAEAASKAKEKVDCNRKEEETKNVEEEEEEESIIVPGNSHFAPIPHDHRECTRVIINVGGCIYETQLRTLNMFPDTLLGDPARRIKYFDPVRNEYFFDRNRPSFDAILYYYQSGGRLRRPPTVPLNIFCEEIDFYELGKQAIDKFREHEGFIKDDEEPLPENLFSRQVYLLLENPQSSTAAKIYACISVFVICFSIFVFCVETLPTFQRYTLYEVASNSTLVEEDNLPRLTDPFFMIESACIAWFALELIARFTFCPNKANFMKDPMNIIDTVSIMPYFLTLGAVLTENHDLIITKTGDEEDEGLSIANLKVLRLARVFRILKLSRHSKGLRVVGLTLKASLNELGLLVFFMSILSIIFSSVAYFAEMGSEDSPFKSIPHVTWWAIVTMTTVGYGDMVPSGILGKMVGSVCVVAGVLTIALPVTFIEGNFNYYYYRETKQPHFKSQNLNQVQSCPFLPDCHYHYRKPGWAGFGGPGSKRSSLDLLNLDRDLK